MPGKADIVTYIILGAFALAIIVFAMMNTGYKGPGSREIYKLRGSITQ
ncbi:MAG: hypothetical protein LV473_13575 [Nitrospira sp.]|nr:hypothetical protein [Nitrospira sp.]